MRLGQFVKKKKKPREEGSARMRAMRRLLS